MDNATVQAAFANTNSVILTANASDKIAIPAGETLTIQDNTNSNVWDATDEGYELIEFIGE